MGDIEERNKAVVIEAFDTLFNKRDCTAAERFWSPHYIKHSAHIEPGREVFGEENERWSSSARQATDRDIPVYALEPA